MYSMGLQVSGVTQDAGNPIAAQYRSVYSTGQQVGRVDIPQGLAAVVP